MGTVDSERKEQAIDELFDKHGSFDDTFLNENDQLHVGFAVQKVTKAIHDAIEKGIELANGTEERQGEKLPINARVNRTTDIMERLGLVEGCLKDSEEYQRLHVDTIKEIIEACRDLYADYQMHHDPRIREVLMKEGLAFPETEEGLEIFDKHNPTEDVECPISAEEMVNRITEKEKQ